MTNRVEIIKNHKYIQYTALEQCLLSQYQLQHDSKVILNFILNKQNEGLLKPVMSSGKLKGYNNIYQKYLIIENISEDLITAINSLSHLDLTWYANPHSGSKRIFDSDNWHQNFWKDFKYLQKIDEYFTEQHNASPVSINERSFQIFNYEKAFEKQQGKSIFEHLHLDLKQLNMYQTYEFPTVIPLNPLGTDVLLIENEDPVFDLAKLYLRDQNHLANFKAIIYSGGQSLIASLKNPLNRILKLTNISNAYYWGDLDGKGIEMMLNAIDAIKCLDKNITLKPWLVAYKIMLNRLDLAQPITHGGNRYTQQKFDNFKQFFSKNEQDKLNYLLQTQTYLPQEVVTINDLERIR